MLFNRKTANLALKPPANISEAQMEQHPSWRRYTRKYQRKKAIVRNIWICNGIIVACLPLNWQIIVLLTTVFLSFCILDETP